MAEEKKTSKGCLIALAVLGLFMVLGIIGVTFIFNKAKDVVQDFATGLGVSPEIMEEVQSLNRTYPFEEPEDQRISEKQVKTFISIKEDFADRIKRHESEFKDLEKRSEDEVQFKQVAEAYRLLGDIRRDFLRSLQKHEMSPKEYMYLTHQIYTTYFTTVAKTSHEQMSEGMGEADKNLQKQLAELEKQLQDPNLSNDMKKALEQSKKSYEKMLTQMRSSTSKMQEEYSKLPEENIELFDKYRSQLEKLNTLGFEYWGLTMGGMNK